MRYALCVLPLAPYDLRLTVLLRSHLPRTEVLLLGLRQRIDLDSHGI
jgi:hypothetical protein